MGSKFLSLIFLLVSVVASANPSCEGLQKLKPALRDNPNFWNAYAEKPPRNDAELQKFIENFEKEHHPTNATAVAHAANDVPTGPRYRLTQSANKDLKKISSQPGLRMKLDQFLQLAHKDQKTFYHELRSQPGKWSLEKIREFDGYSVRLNDGYRVVFRETEDGMIDIINFSKTATHGGH